MSGNISRLTLKDALGKNHCFFVLLGQHHEAEKQNHISLADLHARSESCASQGGFALTVVMVASLVIVVRRK